jgi:hypothetical protein
MSDILTELRQSGVARLEPMTVDEVGQTNAWLMSRPVFRDAHVPQTARNRGDFLPVDRSLTGASEYVCVHTDAAILAPHLLERGLATIDLAAEYLGRDPPVGYSMNAFWTRPGPTIRSDIQEFHRDADDARFLALFFYLTDVSTPEDGAHDLRGPDGTVHTVVGPAGTVFLADTSNEHMGRKPRRRERGIAWFRFGVSDRPPAGVWDKIEPIEAARLGERYPADPRLREAIKLLAC